MGERGDNKIFHLFHFPGKWGTFVGPSSPVWALSAQLLPRSKLGPVVVLQAVGVVTVQSAVAEGFQLSLGDHLSQGDKSKRSEPINKSIMLSKSEIPLTARKARCGVVCAEGAPLHSASWSSVRHSSPRTAARSPRNKRRSRCGSPGIANNIFWTLASQTAYKTFTRNQKSCKKEVLG